MAKKAKGLTARQVDTLKNPGDHADGNGLYLRVTASGMKTWLFRYQVDRRRHAMGLGPIRLKSLSKAREEARELAIKISNGIDPIQERKSALHIGDSQGMFSGPRLSGQCHQLRCLESLTLRCFVVTTLSQNNLGLCCGAFQKSINRNPCP